jgi:hypothetical protein
LNVRSSDEEEKEVDSELLLEENLVGDEINAPTSRVVQEVSSLYGSIIYR